jgi:hypothetical protein
MLENGGESHQSAARFVGWRSVVQDSLTENQNCRKLDQILQRTLILTRAKILGLARTLTIYWLNID